MGIAQGPQNKKDLNVELNLLPVFDVLSVCICFLLMTVVWVEVRSLETKQAFGSQTDSDTKKSSSIWVSIDEKNNLNVIFKKADGTETKQVVKSQNGSIDFAYAEKAFGFAASQKIISTHILPAKTTSYDQVIQIIDLAKKAGVINIGLSPI